MAEVETPCAQEAGGRRDAEVHGGSFNQLAASLLFLEWCLDHYQVRTESGKARLVERNPHSIALTSRFCFSDSLDRDRLPAGQARLAMISRGATNYWIMAFAPCDRDSGRQDHVQSCF